MNAQATMPPILSILVPTRNRAKCLEILLGSLLRQARPYNVEVIVGNNASQDDTYAIIETFQKSFIIKLVNHQTDCGIIGNIFSLISAASGHHSIIFGDDDAPRDDLISLLVNHIYNDSPILSRLPHQYIYTNDPVPEFAGQTLDAESLTTRGKFELVSVNETTIVEFEEKAGFITSHLFNTEALRSAIKEIGKLPQSNELFSNVYLTKLYTLMVLKSAGEFWQYTQPLILQRVPSGADRNFFSNLAESYRTAIVSPAICYSALRDLEPAFANILLRIHFTKYGNFRRYRNMGISRLQMLQTILTYRPKLSSNEWFNLLKAAFR